MSFNVGFIGGGNMSSAIFRGIIKNDVHPSSKIWVSGPHPENLTYWSDMGAHVTNLNGVVFDSCDIVFLGVKPGMLEVALKDIGQPVINEFFNNRCSLLVSMLAGVNIRSLQKTLTTLYPHLTLNCCIARMMPNVPMAVGSGICLITYAYGTVGAGQRAQLESLLKSCGDCEEVPESLIDSLGVLTACGPAYIFMVIEALADGAVKQGVPRAIALRNAALMVRGSANMVLESKKHPAQLKDEVCSPSGSTIHGVSALEEGKLRATLMNALEASTNRTKELNPK